MTALAPFAALQARADRAVLARLANAVAVYQGGAPFGVLFDRAPADDFSPAVHAAAYTCAFGIASAPGLVSGGELVIDGVVYVVASGVLPDSGGWVTLDIFPKN